MSIIKPNKKYSLLEFFEQINVKFAYSEKQYKISKNLPYYETRATPLLKNDNYISYYKSNTGGTVIYAFENFLTIDKINKIKTDPNIIIENTKDIVDTIERPIFDYYELLQQFKFMDFETLNNLKYINRDYYNLLKSNSQVWCDLLKINFNLEANNNCQELYGRLMIGLKFDNNATDLFEFLYSAIRNTDSIFVVEMKRIGLFGYDCHIYLFCIFCRMT